jgi:hypothetical protein
MSSNLQLDRNLVCVSGFGYRENALLCGSTMPPHSKIEASTRPRKLLQRLDPFLSSIAPIGLAGGSSLPVGRVATAPHPL